MKKKAIIVQPFVGKNNKKQIITERQAAENVLGDEYEMQYFTPKDDEPFANLSIALNAMSECEIVGFCAGWSISKVCTVLELTARVFGIKVVFI